MTFGKRTAQPAPLEPDDNCPHCRGAGAIRGRGQRKVCLACKGTGKRAPAPSAPAETSEPVSIDTPAQAAEAAVCGEATVCDGQAPQVLSACGGGEPPRD